MSRCFNPTAVLGKGETNNNVRTITFTPQREMTGNDRSESRSDQRPQHTQDNLPSMKGFRHFHRLTEDNSPLAQNHTDAVRPNVKVPCASSYVQQSDGENAARPKNKASKLTGNFNPTAALDIRGDDNVCTSNFTPQNEMTMEDRSKSLSDKGKFHTPANAPSKSTQIHCHPHTKDNVALLNTPVYDNASNSNLRVSSLIAHFHEKTGEETSTNSRESKPPWKCNSRGSPKAAHSENNSHSDATSHDWSNNHNIGYKASNFTPELNLQQGGSIHSALQEDCRSHLYINGRLKSGASDSLSRDTHDKNNSLSQGINRTKKSSQLCEDNIKREKSSTNTQNLLISDDVPSYSSYQGLLSATERAALRPELHSAPCTPQKTKEVRPKVLAHNLISPVSEVTDNGVNLKDSTLKSVSHEPNYASDVPWTKFQSSKTPLHTQLPFASNAEHNQASFNRQNKNTQIQGEYRLSGRDAIRPVDADAGALAPLDSGTHGLSYYNESGHSANLGNAPTIVTPQMPRNVYPTARSEREHHKQSAANPKVPPKTKPKPKLIQTKGASQQTVNSTGTADKYLDSLAHSQGYRNAAERPASRPDLHSAPRTPHQSGEAKPKVLGHNLRSPVSEVPDESVSLKDPTVNSASHEHHYVSDIPSTHFQRSEKSLHSQSPLASNAEHNQTSANDGFFAQPKAVHGIILGESERSIRNTPPPNTESRSINGNTIDFSKHKPFSSTVDDRPSETDGFKECHPSLSSRSTKVSRLSQSCSNLDKIEKEPSDEMYGSATSIRDLVARYEKNKTDDNTPLTMDAATKQAMTGRENPYTRTAEPQSGYSDTRDKQLSHTQKSEQVFRPDTLSCSSRTITSIEEEDDYSTNSPISPKTHKSTYSPSLSSNELGSVKRPDPPNLPSFKPETSFSEDVVKDSREVVGNLPAVGVNRTNINTQIHGEYRTSGRVETRRIDVDANAFAPLGSGTHCLSYNNESSQSAILGNASPILTPQMPEIVYPKARSEREHYKQSGANPKVPPKTKPKPKLIQTKGPSPHQTVNSTGTADEYPNSPAHSHTFTKSSTINVTLDHDSVNQTKSFSSTHEKTVLSRDTDDGLKKKIPSPELTPHGKSQSEDRSHISTFGPSSADSARTENKMIKQYHDPPQVNQHMLKAPSGVHFSKSAHRPSWSRNNLGPSTPTGRFQHQDLNALSTLDRASTEKNKQPSFRSDVRSAPGSERKPFVKSNEQLMSSTCKSGLDDQHRGPFYQRSQREGRSQTSAPIQGEYQKSGRHYKENTDDDALAPPDYGTHCLPHRYESNQSANLDCAPPIVTPQMPETLGPRDVLYNAGNHKVCTSNFTPQNEIIQADRSGSHNDQRSQHKLDNLPSIKSYGNSSTEGNPPLSQKYADVHSNMKVNCKIEEPAEFDVLSDSSHQGYHNEAERAASRSDLHSTPFTPQKSGEAKPKILGHNLRSPVSEVPDKGVSFKNPAVNSASHEPHYVSDIPSTHFQRSKTSLHSHLQLASNAEHSPASANDGFFVQPNAVHGIILGESERSVRNTRPSHTEMRGIKGNTSDFSKHQPFDSTIDHRPSETDRLKDCHPSLSSQPTKVSRLSQSCSNLDKIEKEPSDEMYGSATSIRDLVARYEKTKTDKNAPLTMNKATKQATAKTGNIRTAEPQTGYSDTRDKQLSHAQKSEPVFRTDKSSCPSRIITSIEEEDDYSTNSPISSKTHENTYPPSLSSNEFDSVKRPDLPYLPNFKPETSVYENVANDSREVFGNVHVSAIVSKKNTDTKIQGEYHKSGRGETRPVDAEADALAPLDSGTHCPSYYNDSSQSGNLEKNSLIVTPQMPGSVYPTARSEEHHRQSGANPKVPPKTKPKPKLIQTKGPSPQPTVKSTGQPSAGSARTKNQMFQQHRDQPQFNHNIMDGPSGIPYPKGDHHPSWPRSNSGSNAPTGRFQDLDSNALSTADRRVEQNEQPSVRSNVLPTPASKRKPFDQANEQQQSSISEPGLDDQHRGRSCQRYQSEGRSQTSAPIQKEYRKSGRHDTRNTNTDAVVPLDSGVHCLSYLNKSNQSANLDCASPIATPQMPETLGPRDVLYNAENHKICTSNFTTQNEMTQADRSGSHNDQRPQHKLDNLPSIKGCSNSSTEGNPPLSQKYADVHPNMNVTCKIEEPAEFDVLSDSSHQRYHNEAERAASRSDLHSTPFTPQKSGEAKPKILGHNLRSPVSEVPDKGVSFKNPALNSASHEPHYVSDIPSTHFQRSKTSLHSQLQLASNAEHSPASANDGFFVQPKAVHGIILGESERSVRNTRPSHIEMRGIKGNTSDFSKHQPFDSTIDHRPSETDRLKDCHPSLSSQPTKVSRLSQSCSNLDKIEKEPSDEMYGSATSIRDLVARYEKTKTDKNAPLTMNKATKQATAKTGNIRTAEPQTGYSDTRDKQLSHTQKSESVFRTDKSSCPPRTITSIEEEDDYSTNSPISPKTHKNTYPPSLSSNKFDSVKRPDLLDLPSFKPETSVYEDVANDSREVFGNVSAIVSKKNTDTKIQGEYHKSGWGETRPVDAEADALAPLDSGTHCPSYYNESSQSANLEKASLIVTPQIAGSVYPSARSEEHHRQSGANPKVPPKTKPKPKLIQTKGPSPQPTVKSTGQSSAGSAITQNQMIQQHRDQPQFNHNIMDGPSGIPFPKGDHHPSLPRSNFGSNAPTGRFQDLDSNALSTADGRIEQNKQPSVRSDVLPSPASRRKPFDQANEQQQSSISETGLDDQHRGRSCQRSQSECRSQTSTPIQKEYRKSGRNDTQYSDTDAVVPLDSGVHCLSYLNKSNQYANLGCASPIATPQMPETLSPSDVLYNAENHKVCTSNFTPQNEMTQADRSGSHNDQRPQHTLDNLPSIKGYGNSSTQGNPPLSQKHANVHPNMKVTCKIEGPAEFDVLSDSSRQGYHNAAERAASRSDLHSTPSTPQKSGEAKPKVLGHNLRSPVSEVPDKSVSFRNPTVNSASHEPHYVSDIPSTHFQRSKTSLHSQLQLASNAEHSPASANDGFFVQPKAVHGIILGESERSVRNTLPSNTEMRRIKGNTSDFSKHQPFNSTVDDRRSETDGFKDCHSSLSSQPTKVSRLSQSCSNLDKIEKEPSDEMYGSATSIRDLVARYEKNKTDKNAPLAMDAYAKRAMTGMEIQYTGTAEPQTGYSDTQDNQQLHTQKSEPVFRTDKSSCPSRTITSIEEEDDHSTNSPISPKSHKNTYPPSLSSNKIGPEKRPDLLFLPNLKPETSFSEDVANDSREVVENVPAISVNRQNTNIQIQRGYCNSGQDETRPVNVDALANLDSDRHCLSHYNESSQSAILRNASPIVTPQMPRNVYPTARSEREHNRQSAANPKVPPKTKPKPKLIQTKGASPHQAVNSTGTADEYPNSPAHSHTFTKSSTINVTLDHDSVNQTKSFSSTHENAVLSRDTDDGLEKKLPSPEITPHRRSQSEDRSHMSSYGPPSAGSARTQNQMIQQHCDQSHFNHNMIDRPSDMPFSKSDDCRSWPRNDSGSSTPTVRFQYLDSSALSTADRATKQNKQPSFRSNVLPTPGSKRKPFLQSNEQHQSSISESGLADQHRGRSYQRSQSEGRSQTSTPIREEYLRSGRHDKIGEEYRKSGRHDTQGTDADALAPLDSGTHCLPYLNESNQTNLRNVNPTVAPEIPGNFSPTGRSRFEREQYRQRGGQPEVLPKPKFMPRKGASYQQSVNVTSTADEYPNSPAHSHTLTKSPKKNVKFHPDSVGQTKNSPSTYAVSDEKPRRARETDYGFEKRLASPESIQHRRSKSEDRSTHGPPRASSRKPSVPPPNKNVNVQNKSSHRKPAGSDSSSESDSEDGCSPPVCFEDFVKLCSKLKKSGLTRSCPNINIYMQPVTQNNDKRKKKKITVNRPRAVGIGNKSMKLYDGNDDESESEETDSNDDDEEDGKTVTL